MAGAGAIPARTQSLVALAHLIWYLPVWCGEPETRSLQLGCGGEELACLPSPLVVFRHHGLDGSSYKTVASPPY